MIELLILFSLFGALAPKVKKKNRSKWLPIIAPILWIISKYICSFIVGLILHLKGMSLEDVAFYMEGAAWGGGILGAAIAFLIVHLLPVKTLKCPKCNHEFTTASDFGVTCEGCGTKLRVSNNKVTELKIAQPPLTPNMGKRKKG